MSFRRQDIPKTTRQSKDGSERRLYPRFIKDRALLPKIDLAIQYLDGMVGRKRSELSPEVILDLFGDPKLARCILFCLAESYRYRTQELAEVVGAEAAGRLIEWDLVTPADLRAWLYQLANEESFGFVAHADRARFFERAATSVGVTAEQLETSVGLDAEPNQRLTRAGEVPDASDIVERYNILLIVSILRHASAIDLTLPGLSPTTVDTLLGRLGIEARRSHESVRLLGRRNTLGHWTGFGSRLARAATHLIALSPAEPSLEATVYLGEQRLKLYLDGKALAPLRPRRRVVSDDAGIVAAAMLDAEIAQLRRRWSGSLAGWTLRRSPEPVIAGGAVLLPEFSVKRGSLEVPVVAVSNHSRREGTREALAAVGATRPVIALGISASAPGIYEIRRPDAVAFMHVLDAVAFDYDVEATPQRVLRSEIDAGGWVPENRVAELFGDSGLPADVETWLDEGEVIRVPEVGFFGIRFLDDLADRLLDVVGDIGGTRAVVTDAIGSGSVSDALTLYLLERQQRAAAPPEPLAA